MGNQMIRLLIGGASLLAVLTTVSLFPLSNAVGAHETTVTNEVNNMPERIDAISKQTKIICFTRFMIDVPATADVMYGRLTAGAEFERLPGRGGQIDAMLSKQADADRKKSTLLAEGGELDKLTGRAIPSSDLQLKHLIAVVGSFEYSVRTYFQFGPDAFVMYAPGVDEAIVKKVMNDHVHAARHLRPRGEAEIPEEPGICLDGAFSTLDTAYEAIEFGVRLKKHPDVHLSMQLIKNGAAVQAVDFARAVDEAKQDGKATGVGRWIDRVKTLRQGKKVVNNWAGEEILLRLPSGDGHPSTHKFAFRVSGEKHDSFRPYVEIALDTGVKGNQSTSVTPSLSDTEAIALWDWFLSSIRVRPTSASSR